MSKQTRNQTNHTGRTARPVLAVAGRNAVASFYFGYWFSH